jgi:hypothetical protein
MNSDIFYKSSPKKSYDDEVLVSSSLFTSSTPNKLTLNNIAISDSDYINNKLYNIHRRVLESDFLPYNNQIRDRVLTGGFTTETRYLPKDDTSSSDSYSATSSSSSYSTTSSSSSYSTSSISSTSESSSSSPTNSSDDSSEPLPPKKNKPAIKRPIKKPIKKNITKKKLIRKIK